jgi:hypothetical protein
LGTFLVDKVLRKLKFSKNLINISWCYNQIFLTENIFWKDSTNFRHRKMTLKLRILKSLTRLFIIFVSLTRSSFREKMHVISGLMSKLIKKSWTVSNSGANVIKSTPLRQNWTSLSRYISYLFLKYSAIPI